MAINRSLELIGTIWKCADCGGRTLYPTPRKCIYCKKTNFVATGQRIEKAKPQPKTGGNFLVHKPGNACDCDDKPPRLKNHYYWGSLEDLRERQHNQIKYRIGGRPDYNPVIDGWYGR